MLPQRIHLLTSHKAQPGYICTEVAARRFQLSNLPSQPCNSHGFLALAFLTSNSHLICLRANPGSCLLSSCSSGPESLLMLSSLVHGLTQLLDQVFRNCQDPRQSRVLCTVQFQVMFHHAIGELRQEVVFQPFCARRQASLPIEHDRSQLSRWQLLQVSNGGQGKFGRILGTLPHPGRCSLGINVRPRHLVTSCLALAAE